MPEKLPDGGKPIKLFCCDLNWIHPADHRHTVVPSLPQDWAYINPEDYFAWHRDFGVNIFFLQGYVFCGYAYYPTKLGPVAPGPGAELFPKLFKMSRKAGLPFCGYFSIALDPYASNLRFDWVVPTSRNYGDAGMLAPESPWTDLLCARITEFLKLYPVEWINFDCFNYGKYNSNDFPVQPSPYVKGPFKEIIGREMPEKASEITPEESLKYKREVMARQFHRIKEAMYQGNPGTRANFNVPFFKPKEPMWVDHPMLNECDQLVAESSDAIVDWLLAIRKPHQRVMTTIVGRPGTKECATRIAGKSGTRLDATSSPMPMGPRRISARMQASKTKWRLPAPPISRCHDSNLHVFVGAVREPPLSPIAQPTTLGIVSRLSD